MTTDLLARLRQLLGAQFTVERELGGGGMSRVFLATETALGRQVVIKLLTPELSAGVNVERFRREIQLAARLQHANIVPVLTTGEIDGLPYFTMPFVAGESLRARLARGGVGVTETLSLLRDVARALAYAHAGGVVHRDIKPENILLSGGAAVVADFGIAKAISAARSNPGAATLTQIGTSIGTPTYMAPEQAAGDQGADHRADLYAFGVVAYELLAGRPPFNYTTPQKQLAAHLAEKPLPILERRPDLPAPLAELVMRCLEKEADHRPQGASDVVRLLDTVTSSASQPVVPAVLLGGQRMLGRALALWAAAFVVVSIIARGATVGIGLPDWVFPGSMLVMVLGLPVILFTAFVQHQARKMVTTTPQLTPGGTPAPQGTLATIAVKASPHVSWRRTAVGGAWAVGVFVLLIGTWMTMRAFGIGPAATLLSAGTINEKDQLIVAEFKSAGDAALGATVTDAFRSDLAQTTSVTVLSGAVVRGALRRMSRPESTTVTEEIARQIATRDGMKAYLAGEVVALGGGYVMSARLVSTIANEELASFRETATDSRDMIPAIGRLSKQIRSKLGDNLRRVQASRSLDKVTTPSLDALQKYVEGTRALETRNDWERGRVLLEEAIALDSGFAMAYRKLAIEYVNRFGSPTLVAKLLQKAYDNRDRLTETERLIMEGSYYMSGPKPDRAAVVRTYEQLLERDPNNVTALNNVAIMYRDLGQYEKAEASAKRAIALQPTAGVFFNNAYRNQLNLGKIAAAESTLNAAAEALPGNAGVLGERASFEWMRGNGDSVVAIARRMQAMPSPQAQRGGNAIFRRVSGARGELEAAQRYRLANVPFARATGQLTFELQIALWRGTDELWYLNEKARALATVEAALKRTPLATLPVADRPLDRLVDFYAQAGLPAKAKQYAAEWEKHRADAPGLDDDITQARMNGVIALSEKRYDDAIRQLSSVPNGDCTICELPQIALAHDLAGRPDSAIAVYERYLADRTYFRAELDAVYLGPTLKRLGELYEAKGDRAKALERYGRFVELWKNADAPLQSKVREVKARMAELQRRTG
ncbi:MAG: protein kinase [Gemmatimonadaceae bacterium]|nr:protein kinase [Gemmatimonadaceae bacterium]